MKVPKVASAPAIVKAPKNAESPAQFKDHRLSWQISFMDGDSKWGFNQLKTEIKFNFGDSLINELIQLKSSNQLSDALTKLSGRKFDGLEDFLSKLSQYCGSCSLQELRSIIKTINENLFWTEVYPKIRHFEDSTWNQIEREPYGGKGKTKHHYISVDRLIPEAQKRLVHLKKDDIDEVFSIRLSGTVRVFGIREFAYLQILWIDFEHEICPSTYN